MASHKLVTIIGIHARERLLDCSEEEALLEWERANMNPDFVAGALFKGGYRAPLTGQTFSIMRVASRATR